MDPDMVRQQEEAELEARLAALMPQKAPAPAAPAALEAAAVEVAQLEIAGIIAQAPVLAPAIETSAPEEKPAPTKQKPRPDRRALPPISARGARTPQPDRIRHGALRGVARFLAYALAGAMLGVILGNVAAVYLDIPPERHATVIFSAAGCFTFICALISILHHEH